MLSRALFFRSKTNAKLATTSHVPQHPEPTSESETIAHLHEQLSILHIQLNQETLCRQQVEARLQESHQQVVALQRDITERQQAESKISASLKEKEVLLKEIHHRVKNNLQIVSSLLKLQAGHLKNSQDAIQVDPNLDADLTQLHYNERSIAAFKDSQHRVRAMALVHEKLYQSEDLARTDFAYYVRSLVQDLVRSYGRSSNPIQVRSTIHDVQLSLDRAIPCGLIINELVSNALKYAFPDGSTGDIHVQLFPDRDDQYVLIVEDNGVGLPSNIDVHNASTLGLQLVCSLTQQLSGTLSHQINLEPTQAQLTQSQPTSSGTSFRITFVDRLSRVKEKD